jgi:hypothetical protein
MMVSGRRTQPITMIILRIKRGNQGKGLRTDSDASLLSMLKRRPGRSSRLERLAATRMVATDTLTKINSNQDFLDITIHSLDVLKSLYRGVVVNRFSGMEYREITVVCQGGIKRRPFQN